MRRTSGRTSAWPFGRKKSWIMDPAPCQAAIAGSEQPKTRPCPHGLHTGEVPWRRPSPIHRHQTTEPSLKIGRYIATTKPPTTESSDSTSGTPAVNMVDSVRVQRAIVALRITEPKIGNFSKVRSMNCWTFSERRQDWKNRYRAPNSPPKMAYQNLTKKSE